MPIVIPAPGIGVDAEGFELDGLEYIDLATGKRWTHEQTVINTAGWILK